MDGEIAQAGGDTIFGKIIRGEIQTPFLYEDDQVFTYRLHAKYSELDHRSRSRSRPKLMSSFDVLDLNTLEWKP